LAQVLEQKRSFWKPFPPLSGRHHLEHTNLLFQRDRQNIAWFNRSCRRLDPPRVEANMPFLYEPGGKRPRPRHAREPQPFVKPLAQLCTSLRYSGSGPIN
jgi:hypothetical protein